MRYSILLGFLAVATSFSPYASAQAKTLAPTADELSRAPLVLEARADSTLSSTEWLFHDARTFGTFGCGPPMPANFVGWWMIEPPDARMWACRPFFPPAPKNALLLKRGGIFVLLAEENFHLLAVYPAGSDRGRYLADMSVREFEELVCDSRRVREAVENLFRALLERQWAWALQLLADPLRRQAQSSKSTEEFFRSKGLTEVAGRYMTLSITSLTTSSAQVRVTIPEVQPQRPGGRVLPGRQTVIRLTPRRPAKGCGNWQIVSLPALEP